MAKKRRFTNKPITKEETEKIAAAAMQGSATEKVEPVEKKKTKGRNQKVLYVSPEHHQEAKKNAFMKGFSQLREYIEHLIDKDKNV